MIRRSLLAALAALVLLVPARFHAQSPARAVAIKGATILTVTKGTIQNGTIVLRNGKIAAVGANVPVPADAEVIDASGRFVSPGIIDCHSHIAADSINEGGTTVSSMTGIEDVLNPEDVNIYRDLAGGLTTANVLHGSANPIGGKNAVIKLRWGKHRAEELLFEGAMPGIKFALGENPKRPGGGAGGRQGNQGPARYPGTRMGVEYVIRDAFTRAKAYQHDWQEYDRKKKAGDAVVAPRRDLQLEPLVEVLEGKRLVHAHSYRADEILMLIRLADEMGFKVATFQHVLEGYKVAKEIAAHGAGASTFSDWWGYKIEAIDAIPYNAALMTRKGVLVSINSDSAEHARRLNTEAAKSMKWGGLSEDEALALVTINPAKQLRIDSRVGSLEVGKDADVVIWNHHPLSSYAIADRVYIDGQKYYDRLDDDRRLTELQKEKGTLAPMPNAPRASTIPPGIGGPAESDVAQPFQGRNGEPAARSIQRRDGEPVTRPVQRRNGDPVARPVQGRDGERAGVLAITNAKIFPIVAAPIERGTIIVRDGVIEAVGADVSVPAGAQVIDAAGSEVYPGFINARATLGLADPGAGGYTDTDEIVDFNPQLKAQVAFHNDSDAIPVARANGITTVAVTPGGGVLGGQIAVMDLDGWTWEESTVKPSIGVAFQFPRIGGRRTFGGPPPPERSYDDMKKERDAKLDELTHLLDSARAYAKAGPGRQTDWVLEALVPVVDRRVPLVTRADDEHDIRAAVAFADRANVKLVISAGGEAALVASLLKEKNIPVILGPVLTLPSREDLPHQASYAAAAELWKAGVKFAFATGDANNARQLPYQAAESVAWGLPRDEALRALTINAADILGVADRLGSVDRGKLANLLIAKGDPLEVRTEVTHVIIAGRDVGVDNRQLALFERYSKRQ